ncbi:hypothetical protein [Actinomycetospora termitidis]|uniref:hypothetical protein n=1 Tax=Actinomycetospora termitidis TaxID=3053470 RepID=UPI0031F2D89D
MLVEWKAALRTDDLARPRMSDRHPSEQSLSVHLSHSKADQHGIGSTIGIAAFSPEAAVGEGSAESTLLDAGAAWTRWRDLLGSHGILEGPAWRGIDRYGRRPRTSGLHRNSIAEIIKRRAATAGLEDAELWGGHSLRRGFATEAIAAGVPERDVQRHGRWCSRASMDPYIDAAHTFDPTNPTHWLT